MSMTKKSANAYLIAQRKIDTAIEQCLKSITPQEREFAESYWAAHIRRSLNGSDWGSMPTIQAADVFDSHGGNNG